jgi:hypothetical protein
LVRILLGEPNLVFQAIRYLIDFITSISEVSSELAPLDSDPGVDSNSLSGQLPPNESAMAYYACQLPAADDPLGAVSPERELLVVFF